MSAVVLTVSAGADCGASVLAASVLVDAHQVMAGFMGIAGDELARASTRNLAVHLAGRERVARARGYGSGTIPCRTSAGTSPGSHSASSAPGWRRSPRRCWC
jgi:hypothetical protein